MTIIYILLAIEILLSLYIIISYAILKSFHKKMFNHRQELNKNIKFYTNEDFDVYKDEYDVTIDDKKIVGHFYHPDKYDENKIIIFCHGMFSTKEAYAQEASYIASKGYYVYLFDYIGTNESNGDSLLGFHNSIYSLDLVINQIENDEKYKNKDIYVFGHSWGGYATTNIVALHPEIKGIIGLSPLVTIFHLLTKTKPYRPMLLSALFSIYDEGLFDKKYSINALKRLQNYSGKMIFIQSKDDYDVSYSASMGLLKKKLKNKDVDYVLFEDRKHNPDYTDNAIKQLHEFYAKAKTTNDIHKLCKETDFHACGELDTKLWDSLIEKML